MRVPAFSLSHIPISESDANVVVFAASSSTNGVVAHIPLNSGYDILISQLSAIGFKGHADELVRLPPQNGTHPSVAVIGVGSQRSPDTLREAAGSAIRQLTGVKTVALDFCVQSREELCAVVEGAAYGSYSYDRYRTKQRQTSNEFGENSHSCLQSITVHNAIHDEGTCVERAITLARAMARVKDLVNTPAAELFPESFAAIVDEVSHNLPVSVTVWDEKALEKEGCGGILGVGQGSVRPPRLVRLQYEPDDLLHSGDVPNDASDSPPYHLALVGKGITFDSGGLSLKPPGPMVGMKYDMTGAATVCAVVFAAAEMKLNIRLTAWLCLAENMPSGSAIRPSDVLTIKNGTTVEIINTDAEGRLVLADGLVAASEEYPDAIIDVATLTGAAMVALGTRYVGVMGDHELVQRLITCGDKTGEHLWHMPMPQELRTVLDSDIADIANANMTNTAAGMLVAATFLREFIGKTKDERESIPWAHLDIAGAASAKTGWGFTAKGPTAVTLRSLLALAEEFSSINNVSGT